MNYKEVIESRYNRHNWQMLLHDIFGNKVDFPGYTPEVPVDESVAKKALYLGKITLPDAHTLAIYEVELSDKVIIERNRAGIRNLLCTNWRGMGCAGAFMFCYRQNEAVLRFSYVSESFAFAEDGTLTKESTDTKRFTYLLGEGHRSRTAIQQFEELKASKQDLKAITKAFSVEALSDMFFKEYKKNYEDIIEFITGKRMVKVANKWEERVTGDPCKEIMAEFNIFPDAEKAVRDYVKKLMGRLVFIQFLQKKGWMGCSAGTEWNDGDKEFVQTLFANSQYKNTFVDDVLEPLFDDINTKREGDLVSDSRVGTGIKVPYLNGGLFEYDDYDKTKFPLPAKYMKQMLDFFASYNFTIDENDPDDAEIGVDPEMLGRIFENLLEDNKDKGAFYTPKEIVQYMCRESLIAYLQTDIAEEATKDTIRQFVTTYNADLLSSELAASVDQKLKDVKICDPAIGSGAFPMGLLKELFYCRGAIEAFDNAAEIKRHIIQQNIYGVDIEKGAVDIARLRFWLALIVDEKTPHALPNMDFKIMQGNSLLEQYKGFDLSTIMMSKKKVEGPVQMTFFEDNVDDLRRQLIALRKEYFKTADKKRKQSLRKDMRGIVQAQIDATINSYGAKLGDKKSEIVKIDSLDISATPEFFLWHTWFCDVFEDGGFDIVIANPPYIGVKGHREIFDHIKSSLLGQYFIGKMDYFYFFFHLSLYLLKEKGVANFITTNYYITADGAIKLRKHLHDESVIVDLLNLGEMRLFENAPGQHNMITMLRKSTSYKNNNIPCQIRDVHRNGALSNQLFASIISGKDSHTVYSIKKQNEIFEGADCYIRLTNNEGNLLNNILDKISLNNLTIGIICEINQGIVSGADYVSEKHLKNYMLPCLKHDGIFVLDANRSKDNVILSEILNSPFEKDLVKIFFKNSDIFKYHTSVLSQKSILFMGKDIKNETQLASKYPTIYSHLKVFRKILKDKRESLNEKTEQWFTLNRGTSHPEVFSRPKIVCPQRSKTNTFGYNELSWYAASDVFFLTNPQQGYNIKYILGLLNSKLYFIWLYNKGKRKGETLELTATPLSEIPIKVPDDKYAPDIIKKVDDIINKKQNPQADTSALETEIDRLVYELYGLTNAEVKIIDPEAQVTGTDNDLFKA